MGIYSPGSTVTCPHCQVTVQLIGDRLKGIILTPHHILGDAAASKDGYRLDSSICPGCRQVVVAVESITFDGERNAYDVAWERLVIPPAPDRLVPPETPAHIARDYREAAHVLPASPKASAALSRRCLQAVLREQGAARQSTLSEQIQAVLPNLPTYIAEQVDAIRVIGNFAAHPIKDTRSGEIVEVEPGEAEWNLDVLDLLFDFYYVGPARAIAKREALNTKLIAAGKRPMR
jgi:hypothetical protein